MKINEVLERIMRVVLLLRCVFSFRGRAGGVSLPPKLIFVVLTGKLGDVVCGTPVLRALRKHFPNARLIVAGETKIQRPVLEDSGLVDGYLDSSKPLREIRKYQADVAIITGPSFTPSALMYLAGVPLVVSADVRGGYSPAETRLYKILKKLITTFPYEIYGYAPRERLRSLESLGIKTDDTEKHLGFSSEAREHIEQFLRKNKVEPNDFLVGLSATAGNKIKEWPTERFAKVADHLVKKYGAKVVLTGGPKDGEKVKEVIVNSGCKLINSQEEGFDVGQLKALISKMSLFIAVDTGPIYIAEAFNVPTIDIVGPVDERVQPPQGRFNRNIVPVRQKAELTILNARDYNYEEALRQTMSITPETVCEEIDKLLLEIKPK